VQHIDDGYGLGAWRNALAFDPLRAYGGPNATQLCNSSALAPAEVVNCTWGAAPAGEPLSYYDIMLSPLAKALSAAISPNTTVYLSMQASPACLAH
jgi:hypothetical protein